MKAQDWVNQNLDRKKDCVLITGASSGIGLEYLKAFAGMGCRCIATSNDLDELSRACAIVRSDHGVEIEEIVADLSVLEGLQAFIDTVRN